MTAYRVEFAAARQDRDTAKLDVPMLNTPRARRGMVTSPHNLASEAGLRVLRDGGNAIEATVAMAASLAVSIRI
jgi:gamma-glutamyltranspeptidase